MAKQKYELTTVDELDRTPQRGPVEPRWKEEVTDEGDGMAYIRLAGAGTSDGWWALDDLIQVTAGFDLKDHLEDARWWSMHPADAVRVMTVFRMIGADDQLTVRLPQQYWTIVKENQDLARQQVHLAEQLRSNDLAETYSAG